MGSYEQAMRRSGLKRTKQRELVYAVLDGVDSPISAEQIYKALLSDAINLSTVYRILENFVDKNIVIKTTLGKSVTAIYELNRQEHKHHLICVKCHAIVAISGCPLEQYVAELSETSHYQILEHKLEILGICPKCQSQEVPNQ